MVARSVAVIALLGSVACSPPGTDPLIEVRGSTITMVTPCDGIANDTPAFQAALVAASVSGGTIQVPEGTCRVGVVALATSASNQTSVVWQGQGSSSRILQTGTQSAVSWDLGNYAQMTFRDITFQGPLSPLNQGYDVFRFGAIHEAMFQRCRFISIGGYRHIIYAGNSGLVVEDSSFEGCFAGKSIIGFWSPRVVDIRRNWFVDFSNLGGTYGSKTSSAPGPWILGWENAFSSGDSVSNRAIRIQDNGFDEGATSAIVFQQQYPATAPPWIGAPTTGRWGSIIVDGMNHLNGGSHSVIVRAANHFQLSNAIIQTRVYDRVMLSISDTKRATLTHCDSARAPGDTSRALIQADNTVGRLDIDDSLNLTVQSTAQNTCTDGACVAYP